MMNTAASWPSGRCTLRSRGPGRIPLETGIFDTLPEILGGWWGIDSSAEARGQLNYLCEKGFRYYWPTVLEAFRLDDHLRQDALFQQRMTSQEDYDKGDFAARKPAGDPRRTPLVRGRRLAGGT